MSEARKLISSSNRKKVANASKAAVTVLIFINETEAEALSLTRQSSCAKVMESFFFVLWAGSLLNAAMTSSTRGAHYTEIEGSPTRRWTQLKLYMAVFKEEVIFASCIRYRKKRETWKGEAGITGMVWSCAQAFHLENPLEYLTIVLEALLASRTDGKELAKSLVHQNVPQRPSNVSTWPWTSEKLPLRHKITQGNEKEKTKGQAWK